MWTLERHRDRRVLISWHSFFLPTFQLSAQWSPWLPPAAQTTMSRFGYYMTRMPEHRLRIISLNTNHAYLLNWWIFIGGGDPDNMLAWLVRELQAAEDAGDGVYLIGMCVYVCYPCACAMLC